MSGLFEGGVSSAQIGRITGLSRGVISRIQERIPSFGVGGQIRSIPAETLRHWIYRYRKGGVQALADRIRRESGTTQVGDSLIRRWVFRWV